MSFRSHKAAASSRTAAALLAALALADADGDARAQAPPARPTFPSQVELITVDAVVLDAGGRPMPGLTRDDFVVKEDGRVQEIASFEAFVLEPPDAPAEPPAVASNEPTGRSGNGRAFAILLDDVRLAPERAAAASSAVASFLDRSVRDGDLVTLRSASGDLSWSARVPEGVEDLLAVLSRLKGKYKAPQSVDSMTEYEAFQIANREDSPSKSATGPNIAGAASGRAPGQPVGDDPAIPGTGLGSTKERVKKRWLDALVCMPIYCDSVVRARAMEIDAERKSRLRATLQAVRRELAALALERGRKSLLLVSEGFLEDYSSDLREVEAASREANTAVYFVDARGLVAQPGFGSVSEPTGFTLPDPREQSAMGFEGSALATAGAQTLADVTGGFSVRNTNDIAAGMERIARESRVFYLLGFYPPPGKSAREWRKLSVEVNRPGLTVRARRGYTLRAEAAARPARRRDHKAEPDAVVVAALDSAADSAAIPLRAMAYVLEPRPRDTVHVLVAAELETSRLAVQPRARDRIARIDVSVVATNRDSGRGFRHDDTIDVPVKPEDTWRGLVREFELPAGVTQVRVAVRDATSGAMGSVSQRFEVPRPGPLRLSTPILSDRVAPARDPGGVPQPALAVHRVFAPGGGLYVQYEVFGAARDPRAGTARVAAGLELWAGGSRLARKVDPTPIAVGADGRVLRQVGLSLEGMEEGTYDVVLDVRDEVSGAALKHRESFVLTRAVATR
jgi:VWFA-related protein